MALPSTAGVKLRVRTAEGEAGDKTFGRRKWQHWFRRWHIRQPGLRLVWFGWQQLEGQLSACSWLGPRVFLLPMTFHQARWPSFLCRLKSHVLPYNSGLLAREALSHPFFGLPGVQHAELPAALSKAFPAPEEA